MYAAFRSDFQKVFNVAEGDTSDVFINNCQSLSAVGESENYLMDKETMYNKVDSLFSPVFKEYFYRVDHSMNSNNTVTLDEVVDDDRLSYREKNALVYLLAGVEAAFNTAYASGSELLCTKTYDPTTLKKALSRCQEAYNDALVNAAEEATVAFLIGSLGTPAVGLLTSATTAYMSASKAKRDFERCTKYAQEDYGKNS
ncbi:MAG: hypothetical protein WCS05_05310 [Bacteroidales bacterium]